MVVMSKYTQTLRPEKKTTDGGKMFRIQKSQQKQIVVVLEIEKFHLNTIS